MKNDFSNKKNDILIQQRNIAVIVAFVSLIIIFLLSVALVKKDTNTIIVPSSLTNSISISGKRPHDTYLEAFTRDVSYTMLNLNPSNIEYAEKSILSISHSSAYGSIKTQFEDIKQSISSKKFSTAFYPISITPDSETLSVLVEGTLYTYLGQKEVSNKKAIYEVKYNYTAGRLTILGFNEVEDSKVVKK
jgi:type IV conjugative transfer system protein TraE